MSDNTNHPDHYNQYETNFNGTETIETIESLGFGFQFCISNAIKYMDRCGKKKGARDTEEMEKAYWYVDRSLMSPTQFQSYYQLECLRSCLAALSAFNIKAARARMQQFINLGLGV